VQLERVAAGRLVAPRAPRGGGRLYTPDDVMRASPPELGIGFGFGHPFRAPSWFGPESPGVQTWLNPTIAAYVEKDGGDRIGALQDRSVSRAQILEDADMELSGTTKWPAARSLGVISKETASPHSGTRNLRVTYDPSWEAAQQTKMTTGKPYRVWGWARSDGSSVLEFNDVAGAVYNFGSPASWEFGDAVFVARNTRLRLRKASAVGVWGEFDDTGLIQCADAIQITAADKPLWVADAGDGVPAVRYDSGNTEWLQTALVLNAAAGTFLFWVRRSGAPGATEVVFGSRDGSSVYGYAAVDPTGGAQLRIGSANIVHGTSIVDGNWHRVAGIWDGTDVTFITDGVVSSVASAAVPSTRAAVLGCFDDNGVRSNYFDGDHGQVGLFDYALTPDQVSDWFANTSRS
jgi:hypothetical protein